MRFTFILGTRPEIIKCLPVAAALESHGARVSILHTAQHEKLAQDAFSAFGRAPDAALLTLPKDRTLTDLLSYMLAELPKVLVGLAPDCVLVQGDTLSAYAGALASFLLQIPVAHIEAGLRTGDVRAPFPEEALRRSLVPFITYHFAPTATAFANLAKEGVTDRVFLVGNPIADALAALCPVRSAEPTRVLVTVHRRESRGEGFARIFSAVRHLALLHGEFSFLCPLHPSVQKEATALLVGPTNLQVTEPLAPNEFYRALSDARLVLTDSGGVTEEAAMLGIPTVVVRDSTERTEELTLPYVRLGSTSPACILAAAEELLSALMPPSPPPISSHESPSRCIAQILREQCGF